MNRTYVLVALLMFSFSRFGFSRFGGPCFIEYHKDNVFTYCYCKFSRCNVPQKPIRHDRYMARMLLVDPDHPD
ncbi:Protein CBG28030 [Caenorhabditis briggsae]|uniref:Protein CBG28030 n=2 Tax=Caenorhabditis briggsae TaxID=6238 RepID=B6IG26_CAEBR|nr:Protein CBG28030 [Caenorhabditis briggsae]ULT84261.1 hypothetical protein L3Y34_013133 [Caenorhabditis briggsae]CAR98856.1 Protein CBG28030 [Caenorhabditis briggsae]